MADMAPLGSFTGIPAQQHEYRPIKRGVSWLDVSRLSWVMAGRSMSMREQGQHLKHLIKTLFVAKPLLSFVLAVARSLRTSMFNFSAVDSTTVS